MTSDSIDDGMLERMIGDLRTIDGSVGPDRVFTVKLERTLRSGFTERARKRGFSWPRLLFGLPNLVHAATVALVIAIVGATVLATWDRGSGGSGGVVPAASSVSDGDVVAQVSPSAQSSPVVTSGEIPTAEELLQGCDVERRADGQAEAMLAATSWSVTTSMPFVGIDYPIYVGDWVGTFQELDEATDAALNSLLASLYACSIRDLGESLYDPATVSPKIDGYFFAGFSDNYLRRAEQRTSIWPGESWLPIPTVLEGLGSDGQLKVVSSWDVNDWDSPRVTAYVANTSTRWNPQFGYLMTFVQVDGIWQIDEVALATVDPSEKTNSSSYLPALVGDLMLFDHGMNPVDPNVAFAAPSAYGPYEQGKDAMLRIFNFSSETKTVSIDDLGISVTVEPGGTATVTIDGEPGTYKLVVDPLVGDQVLEVQIVPPGTVLEGLG